MGPRDRQVEGTASRQQRLNCGARYVARFAGMGRINRDFGNHPAWFGGHYHHFVSQVDRFVNTVGNK